MIGLTFLPSYLFIQTLGSVVRCDRTGDADAHDPYEVGVKFLALDDNVRDLLVNHVSTNNRNSSAIVTAALPRPALRASASAYPPESKCRSRRGKRASRRHHGALVRTIPCASPFGATCTPTRAGGMWWQM